MCNAWSCSWTTALHHNHVLQSLMKHVPLVGSSLQERSVMMCEAKGFPGPSLVSPSHSRLTHMKTTAGLATSSTPMVRRLRCSTLSPLTPGMPTKSN